MSEPVNYAAGSCHENEKFTEEEGQRLAKLAVGDLDVETHELAPVVPFPTLTEREREVALRLALGISNGEVAEELGISPKTVDTHRAHVLKKLELRNNVELARYAIREGYLQP